VNGFLVVDKPGAMTSHDVIARCRRALGERRVGHAGTLDPMATGILVVGVGRATRLLRFLEDLDKEYVAGVTFGATTTTQDADGDVLDVIDASGLDAAAVEAALAPLRGDIEQVPPMVSAVKIGGERLYRKARRGEEIERPARRVTVHELSLLDFEPGERARATLRVRCSKGTYVRTIAADTGAAAGTGAHLHSLRRTRVGPHRAEDAVALDDVAPGALRAMEDAVAGYPRRDVDADGARALVQGKALARAGIDGPYAVFGPDGLVAMAEDVREREEARSLCVVTGP
jgi:tRNA pseudouridine55 synthase